MVQDAKAIHAVASGDFGVTFAKIYDLVNRGVKRAVTHKSAIQAAAMIRRELPILVGRLTIAYPRVQARLAALRLRTRLGRKMRALTLGVMHDDFESSRSFNADVSRSRYVFTAVERWGSKNNALVRKDKARAKIIFDAMPPAERATLVSALYPAK